MDTKHLLHRPVGHNNMRSRRMGESWAERALIIAVHAKQTIEFSSVKALDEGRHIDGLMCYLRCGLCDI